MSLLIVPKKSLGQNFLNSERVVSKIINAAEPGKDDIILEIGPGLGAITQQLIHFAGKVVAVEKDLVLFETLSNTFSQEIQSGKLDLVSGDILDFDPKYLSHKKTFHYKIAANIPYNITGLIIRKFLSTTYQPQSMVLLIQKEVADRILARDKKQSLLSLSVQVYGTPKLVTHVSRGNFNPPPRVDSTVIKITDISRKNFPNKDFEELFFTIIHAGFAHKRKMLIKNLVDAGISNRANLELLLQKRILPVTTRSEDLSIDDWLFITKTLYNNH